MRPLWSILAMSACQPGDLDGDGVPATRDCNDGDPAQQLPRELFVDGDGDGFGGATTDVGCLGSAWLVESADDCDDHDFTVYPGAIEIGCDGRDNDCNPLTVDGPAYTTGATWSTVQQALDRVGYQETVHLCGSTIHEAVIAWRPATVVGAGTQRTILDGTGSGRATVEVRASLTLRGLTVTGGVGSVAPGVEDPTTYGGGIAVFDAEDVILDDLRIHGNTADAGGGVAVLGDVEVLGTALQITGNHADRGGGAYLAAPSARLDDTAVVGNVADVGGGIWLDGLIDGESLRIADNRAARGGGLHLQPNAVVWGDGTEIVGNLGTSLGGGLHGAGVVREAVIDGNLASSGGGIYAIGAVTLDSVRVHGNHASEDGGGMTVGPASVVTVNGGSWVANGAVAFGGGIHASYGAVSLIEVVLDGNHARSGAGLSCDRCSMVGTALEVRNGAALLRGGALDARCGTVHLADSVITLNAAPQGGAIRAEGGLTTLAWSISDGDLALLDGCDGGRLEVEELVFAPADLITVGLSPAIPLPGPSFRCRATAAEEACQTE